MNDDDKVRLLNDARYAERLCLRTARLYRRLQAVASFFTVVGGSATLSALSQKVPDWVSITGAASFVVFGAFVLVVRPADKAAQNEGDAKRYAKIRTDASALDAEALQAALDKAHETDVPEIEPLRDVAYNDVAMEVGRPDAVVKLRPHQRLLAALA